MFGQDPLQESQWGLGRLTGSLKSTSGLLRSKMAGVLSMAPTAMAVLATVSVTRTLSSISTHNQDIAQQQRRALAGLDNTTEYGGLQYYGSQANEAIATPYTQTPQAIHTPPNIAPTIAMGMVGAGVGLGASYTLSKLSARGLGAGPIGLAGLVVLGALTGMGMAQGVNVPQTAYTNFVSGAGSWLTKDPYADSLSSTGLPHMPTLSGGQVAGTSDDNRFIGGQLVQDPSIPSRQSNITLSNTIAVTALTLGGAALGLGALNVLDKVGANIYTRSLGTHAPPSIKALASVLESKAARDVHLPLAQRVSTGKNFAPILIGAIAGGLIGDRTSPADMVTGMVVGGLGASTLNYFASINELGPQVGKRWMIAALGALAANAVFGAYQQTDRAPKIADLQPDLPKTDRYTDPAKYNAPADYSPQALQPDTEGYLHTKTGKVRLPGELVIPISPESDPIAQEIATTRYMTQGSVTASGEYIFYDSGSIGRGMVNYLQNLSDSSLEAAVYELDSNPTLMTLLQRKAAPGGLRVSGGANIHGDPLNNLGNLAYALTKPWRLLQQEGISSATSAVGSWFGMAVNTLTESIGLGPAFTYKNMTQERTTLGTVANTLLYAGAGSLVGGMVGRSPMARLIGAGVGAAIGLLQPTYIDQHYYQSVALEAKRMTGEGYYKYYAYTDGGGGVENKVAGAALGSVMGASLGYLLGRRARSTLIGMGLGAVAGGLAGLGNIARAAFTQGIDITKQTTPVLQGERTPNARRTKLEILHAKALVGTNAEGGDEFFISTGNMGTMYRSSTGVEDQINFAIRGRDKAIAGQLRKVMGYLDHVTPTSDLRELADASPNLILGGKGADSTRKLVDHILTREGNLYVSFPYITDPQVVDALLAVQRRGQNVLFIANNPYGLAGGGNQEMTTQQLRRLMEGGVQVYMGEQTSDVLAHAKFIATENSVLVTSHNASRASDRNVIELGLALDDKSLGHAGVQAFMRAIVRHGLIDPRSKRDAFPELFARRDGAKGLEALLNLKPGALETGGLLAPTQMGASYFYARGLHNNLMRQAGTLDKIITSEDASTSTALFEMGYMARYGAAPVKTPWIITQADRELTSGGWGAALNEMLLPLGIGRFYKDEVGLVPSIFGAVGALLDKGWLDSYTYATGKHMDDSVIDRKRQGYSESRDGLFESALTFTSNIIMSSASAVSFYLLVGEPLSVLVSELSKSHVEGSINALIQGGFRDNVASQITRQFSLGLGKDARTVQELRRELALGVHSAESGLYNARTRLAASEKLVADLRARGGVITQSMHDEVLAAKTGLRELEALGEHTFYSIANFNPSIYHVASLAMRKRAQVLAEDIMYPFLTNEVNPFVAGSTADLKFRDATSNLLREVGRPALLTYEGISEGVNGEYKAALDQWLSLRQQASRFQPTSAEYGRLMDQAKQLESHVDDALSTMSVKIGNVGVERSSRVALALQNLLNEVPLIPVQWGQMLRHTTAGGLLNSKEVVSIGDIFSFHDASRTINEGLFGRNGISSIIQQFSNTLRPSAGAVGTYSVRNVFDRVQSIYMAFTTGSKQVVTSLWERYRLSQKVNLEYKLFLDAEVSLLSKQGIHWAGEGLEPKAWEHAYSTLATEGLDPSHKNYSFRAHTLANEYLAQHTDAMKEVVDLHDETWVKAMRSRSLINTPEEALRLDATITQAMHAEASRINMNSIVSGEKRADRVLDRLRRGIGQDATSAISKMKYGTVLMGAVVLGLIGNQLFRATGGKSYFTSLGEALQSGHLDLPTNTEFGGARLFGDIGGVPIDVILAAALIVPANIVARAKQGYATEQYGFSIENFNRQRRAGSAPFRLEDLNRLHPIGGLPDASLMDGWVNGVRRAQGAADNVVDIHWAGTLGSKDAVIIEGMRLEGNYFKRSTLTKVGGVMSQTMINWGMGILALGFVPLALSGISTLSRNVTSNFHQQGTLDPVLLGLGGAGAGLLYSRLRGKSGPGSMAIGALAGMTLGLFTEILKVGRPGQTVKGVDTAVVGGLVSFKEEVYARARYSKASRLELMAALYAEGITKANDLLDDQVKGLTTVVARQVTFPFLQFFLAESTKGATYNEDGKLVNPGTKYYAFGIQGPVSTGTSIPFQAPFKIYSKSTGGMGIALNEKYDVLDFFANASALSATAYASLATASALTYLVNGSRSLGHYMGSQASSTLSKLRGIPSGPNVYQHLTLPGRGLQRAAHRLVDLGVDIALTAPEMGATIFRSMFVSDYGLANQALTTWSRGRFWAGAIGRGFIWATVLSQLGGAIGGAMSKDPSTTVNDIYTGQMVGAGLGIGTAIGLQYLVRPSAIKSLSTIKTGLNALHSIPAPLKTAVLFAGMAYFLTDSNFGRSIAMDNDPIQRMATMAMYGIAAGALYGSIANVGQQAGDTIQSYLSLKQTVQALPASDAPFPSLRRWFLESRLRGLENEVSDIRRNLQGSLPKVGRTISQSYERMILANQELGSIATRDLKATMNVVDSPLAALITHGRGVGVSWSMLPSKLTWRRLARGAGLTFLIGGAVTMFTNQQLRNDLFNNLDSSDNVLMRSLGDAIRLQVGIDSVKHNLTAEQRAYQLVMGMPALAVNTKLLQANKNAVDEISKMGKDISRLLLIDDPNTFVGVNGMGLTLRNKDQGLTPTAYFQIQGPGADVSTAAYTMASNFMFQGALAGNMEMAMLVSGSMREYYEKKKAGVPLNQATMRRVAASLINTTANLQPLQKARRFSRASEAAMAAASKDPILTEVLSDRDMMARNLAYQPYASLASKLVQAALNTESSSLDSLITLLGSKDSRERRDALSKLYSDPFGLKSRDNVITSITFFTGQGYGSNQGPIGDGPQQIPMEDQSYWLESDFLAADTPRPQANFLAPLRALMSSVPGPIAFGAMMVLGAATLGYGLVMMGSSSITLAESALETSTREFYKDWFPEHVNKRTGYAYRPFRVTKLRDALGNFLGSQGKTRYALNKGNYFLSLDPTRTQEILSMSAQGHIELAKGVNTLQGNLAATLDLVGGSQRIDLYPNLLSGDTSIPGPGTMFERITSPNYLQGIEERMRARGLIDNNHLVRGSRATFLSELASEFEKPIQEVLSNYLNEIQGAELGTGRPGAMLRLATGSNVETWDELTRYMHSSQNPRAYLFGQLDSSGNVTSTLQDVLQSEVKQTIDEVLQQELRRPALIGDGRLAVDRMLQYGGGDLQGVARALSIKVMHRLSEEGKVMYKLRHTFAGLFDQDKKIVEYIEESIGDAIRTRNAVSNASLPTPNPTPGSPGEGPGITQPSQTTSPAVQKAQAMSTRQRSSIWASLKGAGMTVLDVGGFAFDVFQGLDIISSYNRFSRSLSDESFTVGEQTRLAHEAGETTTGGLLALAALPFVVRVIPWVGSQVMAGGAMVLGALGGLVQTGLAAVGVGGAVLSAPAWAIGLLTAVAVGGTVWAVDKFVAKGAIGRTIGNAVQGISEAIHLDHLAHMGKTALDSVGSVLGKGYNWVSDRIGEGVLGLGRAGNWLGDKLTGGAKKDLGSALVSAVGWGIGGAVVGAGLALSTTFALGLAALGLPALGAAAIIGGTAGVFGFFGFLSGLFNPTGSEKVTTAATNYMAGLNVPIIGALTTMPGAWIHDRFKELKGSPFFLGTPQQALQEEYRKYINARKDYTGAATASYMANSSLVGQGTTFMAEQPGFSLRAESFIDPYLQSELSIRGQYYNHGVMGRSLWQMDFSDTNNKAELRSGMQAGAIESKNVLDALVAAHNQRVDLSTSKVPDGGLDLVYGVLQTMLPQLLSEQSDNKQLIAKVQVKAPTNTNIANVKPNAYVPTETMVSGAGKTIQVKQVVRADASYWNNKHSPYLNLVPGGSTTI